MKYLYILNKEEETRSGNAVPSLGQKPSRQNWPTRPNRDSFGEFTSISRVFREQSAFSAKLCSQMVAKIANVKFISK